VYTDLFAYGVEVVKARASFEALHALLNSLVEVGLFWITVKWSRFLDFQVLRSSTIQALQLNFS
jgi:hypothetical protein